MWVVIFLVVFLFILFPNVRRKAFRLISSAGGLITMGVYGFVIMASIAIGFVVGFISFLTFHTMTSDPRLSVIISIVPGIATVFFIGKGAIKEVQKIIGIFKG